MVGKGLGLGVVVVEHAAVGGHPGDPQAASGKPFQPSGPGEHIGGAEQLRAGPQIPPDLLAHQIVAHQRNAHSGGQYGNQRDEGQLQIDFLLHSAASDCIT